MTCLLLLCDAVLAHALPRLPELAQNILPHHIACTQYPRPDRKIGAVPPEPAARCLYHDRVGAVVASRGQTGVVEFGREQAQVAHVTAGLPNGDAMRDGLFPQAQHDSQQRGNSEGQKYVVTGAGNGDPGVVRHSTELRGRYLTTYLLCTTCGGSAASTRDRAEAHLPSSASASVSSSLGANWPSLTTRRDR